VNLRAALVLVFGTLCVSTAAIFFRQADAPALVKATWRLLLATAILAPLAWATARDEIRALTRTDLRRALAAGAALAAHFALWVPSLDYTSVASSVVLVTTNPFFVGLAAPFVLGERVGRRLAAGIAMAFVGTTVIVLGDAGVGGGGVGSGGTSGGPASGGSLSLTLLGDLLALGGAAAAAVYFLFGRHLRGRMGLVPYIAVVYGAAALMLAAVCVAAGLPLFGYSAWTWAMFLLLALVPQVLGHSSYNWALQHLSATFVAGAVLGEPIGSTLLAWLILGEVPTRATLAGGAMILTGLVIAARGEARRGRDSP